MNTKKRKMIDSFTKFDDILVNDLQNPDFAIEYFEAILQEYRSDKDLACFLSCLKPLIEAKGSISAFAKKIGLSRAYLYKIFKNKVKPELETLEKIFNGLGFELCISIKKAA